MENEVIYRTTVLRAECISAKEKYPGRTTNCEYPLEKKISISNGKSFSYFRYFSKEKLPQHNNLLCFFQNPRNFFSHI